MPCSSPVLVAGALAALLPVAALSAQNTTPHWSGFVGTAARDHAVAIAPDPSGGVVVAGHTTDPSGSLATTGAFQPMPAGGNDAFVALVDPRRPCGQEVVWCTYFGGPGLELVFDVHVERNGVVTVVGLSASATLPAGVNQAPPLNNGATDGFVARFAPGGSTLLASMFVGGSADDRICDVEIDAAGAITVAGVTEAPRSLPNAANSYHGGPSDAFVARVVPSQPVGSQVPWSYYLGGNGSEGLSFGAWGGLTVGWEGNLDRMGLALDPAGNPAVVTASVALTALAPVTPGACQPVHADAGTGGGFSDAYLAVVDPSLPPANQLVYATFCGGTGSDRPHCIAPHPGGGFVLGGYTFSQTLPVTPNCLQRNKAQAPSPFVGLNVDGFLCHIDPGIPGPAGLRYATYLGGNAGEDAVFALAVESSGVVTVAGESTGGNFPVTARCLQPGIVPGAFSGMIARIRLAARGAADLLYSTFAGGAVGSGVPGSSNLTGIALDAYGDLFATGYSSDPNYPNAPCIGGSFGGRDAVLTHLPARPGCTGRGGMSCATPACAAPMYAGIGGALLPGARLDLHVTNAPPLSSGVLVFGVPVPCTPIAGAGILVGPIVTVATTSDALGAGDVAIPIPPSFPPTCPIGLSVQWVFPTNAACAGSGALASSERIDI